MAVSFGVLSGLFVRGIRQSAAEESRAEAVMLARALAASFAVPLARGQHEVIQRQVDQIVDRPDHFPDVESVVVADPAGRVVAHTDPSRFGDDWGHPAAVREAVHVADGRDGLPMHVVTLPVGTAIRFGTLEVSVVAHGPWESARKATRTVVLGLMAIMLLLVAALSVLLHRTVVRPIGDLAGRVAAVDPASPEPLPDVRGPREIQLLAASFNDLARRLREYTLGLEQKVQERTRELRSAYDRLTVANRQLQELAVTDGLTGVSNRRAFSDRLALEVDRARRTRVPVSLVLFDLDHFKRLNDTLGHLEGDAALVQLAGVLTEGRRAADLVARYGGEEFVLLLPETPHADAMIVAERIRQATEEARLPANCTVSAGVATLPDHAEGARELVEAADQALYAAKRTGRNRVMSAAQRGLAPVRAEPA